MNEHEDTAYEGQERDELLGAQVRSLGTSDHADGFFAGLEGRLDEVDAARASRWRFSSRRWVAFGSVTAAAAALVVAGFLISSGPQKGAVQTASSTLGTTQAPLRAPTASPEGTNDSAASKSAGGASPGALMDSTQPGGTSASLAPRPLPDLATASDLLGMRVRALSSKRAGRVHDIGLIEQPAVSATGVNVVYREVTVSFSGGFLLHVSPARLTDPVGSSGLPKLVTSAEDYQGIVTRASLSSVYTETMPQLVRVAGHEGIAETDVTPKSRPAPTSIRWNDADGFYTLGYLGEPDSSMSVADLVAVAASMY